MTKKRTSQNHIDYYRHGSILEKLGNQYFVANDLKKALQLFGEALRCYTESIINIHSNISKSTIYSRSAEEIHINILRCCKKILQIDKNNVRILDAVTAIYEELAISADNEDLKSTLFNNTKLYCSQLHKLLPNNPSVNDLLLFLQTTQENHLEHDDKLSNDISFKALLTVIESKQKNWATFLSAEGMQSRNPLTSLQDNKPNLGPNSKKRKAELKETPKAQNARS